MDLIARASEIPTRERAKVIMDSAKAAGAPSTPPPKRRNSAPSDAAELRKMGLDSEKPKRGRSRIKELLQTGVGDMVEIDYKPPEKPDDKKKKMMLVKAIIEKRSSSKKTAGTAPSKKYKPIDRPKAMGGAAAWLAVNADDEPPPPRPSKKKSAEPRRDPESIKAMMSTDAPGPPPEKAPAADKKKKKHKDSFLDSELEFTYQEGDMTFGAPGVKELPSELFRPETLSIAIAKGKMEAYPGTPKRKKDSSPPPPPPPIADLIALEAEEKSKAMILQEKKKANAKKRAEVRKMLKTRSSDPGALPTVTSSGSDVEGAPKPPEEDYIDWNPSGSPSAVVVLDGMEESVNWAHGKKADAAKKPPSKPAPVPTKKQYVDDDEDEVDSVDEDVDLGSDEEGADLEDDGEEVPDAELKKHEVFVMEPDDHSGGKKAKSAPGTRASHYYYEVELVNKAKAAASPKSPKVAIVKDEVEEDIDEPDCEPPDEDDI